ncbi:hypothetical protein D3C71_972560 [compost metagenome]
MRRRTGAVGIALDDYFAIRVLLKVLRQFVDVHQPVGFQLGLVGGEQHVTEGHQRTAIGLLGIEAVLQLFDLLIASIEARLGPLRGSVFQIGFSGAQGDGLLRHFNALVGQIGQLVHFGLIFLVQISLVGFVQIIARFLGFQRRDFARLRVGLQAGIVGAGLFKVGIRWCRTCRQGNACGQQGRDHQLFGIHGFVLLVD